MADTRWTPQERRVIFAAEVLVEYHYPTVARQVRADNKTFARTCARCSHRYDAHVHQRTHHGTDCGTGGSRICPAFIQSTRLSRAWRRWQNRKAVGA